MGYLLLCMGLASAIAAGGSGGGDWATVKPDEFEGAINNPLKGFRSYHDDGYTDSCIASTLAGTPLNSAPTTRLIASAARVVVAHPGHLQLIFRSKQMHNALDAEKLAKLLALDAVPSVHARFPRLP